MAKEKKNLVIVLGMHRSGTSALAGILSMSGIDFGSDLMPRSHENPKGYYEDNFIVETHDKILTELGSAWDDPDDIKEEDRQYVLGKYKDRFINYLSKPFLKSDLCGFKDPRTSKFLFLWKEIFRELNIAPFYIILARDVEDVCRSLLSRDSMEPILAANLWVKEYAASLSQTSDSQRIFVYYDQMLSDPIDVLIKIKDQFGLDKLIIEKDKVLSFIDPAQNRSGNIHSKTKIELPLSVIELSHAFKKEISIEEISMLIKKALDDTNSLISGKHYKSLKVPRTNFQVFFDYGEGYSETGSVIFISPANTPVNFEHKFTVSGRLEKIRVDLADVPGTIISPKLEVTCRDKTLIIYPARTSKKITMKDLISLPSKDSIVSTSDNPRMIIDYKANNKDEITIRAQYTFIPNISGLPMNRLDIYLNNEVSNDIFAHIKRIFFGLLNRC